jgi:hypothetical protein
MESRFVVVMGWERSGVGHGLLGSRPYPFFQLVGYLYCSELKTHIASIVCNLNAQL